MSGHPYRITKDKFLSRFEQVEIAAKVAALGPRDRALLLTAMTTGARAREILNMRLGDTTDQTIYVYGIKGSDSREIPIPPATALALKELRLSAWADKVDGNAPIFPISYSRFVQLWKKVAPEGKSIKSLRHTFAIELYKQTRDIFLVKRALGHRCITNTMVYVDYVLSTEHLQEIKKVNLYGLPRE